MSELQVIEVQGQRVLTTKQIADAYETQEWKVKHNYGNNKQRYILGKHYIKLEGKELQAFKNKGQNLSLVGKNARVLYLWTERGALLHAKSINTDKAWQVYDYLVDSYFRQQSGKQTEQKNEIVPVKYNIKEAVLPEIKNPIRMLNILLRVAEDKGIEVDSYSFEVSSSVLYDNKIGIKTNVTVEKACYELAMELSHVFIHYDAGDMINSPLAKDYNKQAVKAAEMIIKVLNVC